jgi:superfamily II DNA or RNA helicase
MQLTLDIFPDAPSLQPEREIQLSPVLQELRPYQLEAVTKGKAELLQNRSTLIVMPTGTGKTRVFTEFVTAWPFVENPVSRRCLIIAHRDELLQQARKRMENETGEVVGLEQASYYAGNERIVVASIQTISKRKRLERWKPEDFGLVVFDEAHHACSPTWRRVQNYFAGAKVLGVTATPDRADEKAMGMCFESVAYVYEIEDAIRDSWLVPIRVRQIFVDSVDLSKCNTVAGDFNQGELDAAMAVEEALHGVVDATIREAGDRRTLVYTTSVNNVNRIAEIFCRYRPGSARAVHGGTPIDTRRSILGDFGRGGFQYLVNCGIATEGYDNPPVSCIAQARPTKSRSLHAQIVGRGLRPFAGKEDCLVLEFTGNSGKHRLACCCDILGGRYDEAEVDEATEIVKKKPGMRADEALAEARENAERRKAEEAAKRLKLKAQVQYKTRDFDPFSVFHMERRADEQGQRFGSIPSDAQIALLSKFGIDTPKDCTRKQASDLIGKAIQRSNQGLATFKMVRALERAGIPALNLSFDAAGALLGYLRDHGWQKPPIEVYNRIVSRERQAGE